METKKLFVGELPVNMSSEQFTQYFTTFGEIEAINVMTVSVASIW